MYQERFLQNREKFFGSAFIVGESLIKCMAKVMVVIVRYVTPTIQYAKKLANCQIRKCTALG